MVFEMFKRFEKFEKFCSGRVSIFRNVPDVLDVPARDSIFQLAPRSRRCSAQLTRAECLVTLSNTLRLTTFG